MAVTRFPGAIRLTLLVAVSFSAACGPETPTPPDTSSMVIPTKRTGPTQITFVNATPPPGSQVSGCGPLIAGCRGRVRMVFQVLSQVGGPALYMRVFLHATNQQACLLTQTPSLLLPRGQPLSVEVVFDDADVCSTPLTIANMAAVVEGTVEIASRQEWSLRYTFAP